MYQEAFTLLLFLFIVSLQVATHPLQYSLLLPKSTGIFLENKQCFSHPLHSDNWIKRSVRQFYSLTLLSNGGGSIQCKIYFATCIPLGLVHWEIWGGWHKLISDVVSNQGTSSPSKLNLREDPHSKLLTLDLMQDTLTAIMWTSVRFNRVWVASSLTELNQHFRLMWRQSKK